MIFDLSTGYLFTRAQRFGKKFLFAVGSCKVHSVSRQIALYEYIGTRKNSVGIVESDYRCAVHVCVVMI